MILAAAVLALLGLAAQGQSRRSVLAQLQRPARPAAFAGASRSFSSRKGPLRVTVRLTPDRASVRNELTVSADQHGRPLSGARITARFSMPSMGMWNVFATTLSATGTAGVTEQVEPVLGMAGVWRIDLAVHPKGDAKAIGLAIDTRMNG